MSIFTYPRRGAKSNLTSPGSFNVYAARFFSPSYAFALSWNYWFNDAISVASDLTAAQLVLQYWTPWHPWVISLLFWVFLVGVNAAHVKAYGEIGKVFPLNLCSKKAELALALGRILACIAESHHDCHIHHHWHTGQCWRQYLTFIHRRALLPPPRGTRWLRRWFRRVRTGICDCEFCL